MKNLFTQPIHVRFQDIDRLGHVHNALFFTYYTEARLSFFQKLIDNTSFSSFPSIMAHTSCDFLIPIKAANRICVGLRVKEIGTKSFKLGYEIVDEFDETIVYSRSESVQVCFDYKENKSIEIPEELRNKLIRYQ